jgi:hypothetical protein
MSPARSSIAAMKMNSGMAERSELVIIGKMRVGMMFSMAWSPTR